MHDDGSNDAASPGTTPSLVDLLVDPFTGFAIYRRAADVGKAIAFATLLLGLLLGAVLVGAVQIARFSATIDAMEDSSISFMPRVNIVNGWATVEAAPGRVIETDRAVIVFDTRPEPEPLEKATGDDTRDRVLVGDRALIWYSPDRDVPLAMPWGVVNQQLGDRVSVDGSELIASLRRTMPRTVGVIGAMIAGVFLVWELLLVGVLVGMYRTLFGRRLGSPAAGRVFVTACLGTLPATLLGVAVLLVLGRQELAVLVHGAVLGSLVLIGGNSLVGLPVLRKVESEGEPAPKAVATEL